MLTTFFHSSLKATALTGLATLGIVGGVGCAQTSSAELASKHSTERAELAEKQVDEQAELDRKQREARVDLAADQAREHVAVDATSTKKEVTFEAEQERFAIDVKEKLAKLDARIDELRRTGHSIDMATLQARDEVARDIAACDGEMDNRDAWLQQKESIQVKLTALTNQVKREEAEG